MGRKPGHQSRVKGTYKREPCENNITNTTDLVVGASGGSIQLANLDDGSMFWLPGGQLKTLAPCLDNFRKGKALPPVKTLYQGVRNSLVGDVGC